MKRSNNCGFTMIEMIMVVAIGAFVVGGIVFFTRNVTENTMILKARLAALDVAQRQMDVMMNDYYNDVAVGDTDTTVNGFIVRQTVTETETQTPGGYWVIGLKRIVILVDTPGGNFVNPLVRLVTDRESQIPYENDSRFSGGG